MPFVLSQCSDRDAGLTLAEMHVCVLTSFIKFNKALTKFNEALTKPYHVFDRNYYKWILDIMVNDYT